MAKKVVANTDKEKRKGLTGAPDGSVGIFNYMDRRPRQFHKTDRDLDVYADGEFVGQLNDGTPVMTTPPANVIEERPVTPGDRGMMKARMAIAAEFGNPSAKRMVSANPKTYDFGSGETGTHFMESVDNYAVPHLQDKGGDQLEYFEETPPPGPEDMRFESSKDAETFAKHYKDVAPMMSLFNGMQNGGDPLGTATMQDSLNLYNRAKRLESFYGGLLGIEIEEVPVVQAAVDANLSDLLSGITEQEHLSKSDLPESHKNVIRNKTSPQLHYMSDMIHGLIDPRAPMSVYDERIKPQGFKQYIPKGDKLFRDMVSQLGWSQTDEEAYWNEIERLQGESPSWAQPGTAGWDKWWKESSDRANREYLQGQYWPDPKKAERFGQYARELAKIPAGAAPGWNTMVPYYDPIMVKPWHMLTDEEKAYRQNYSGAKPKGTTDPKMSVAVNLRKRGLDSSFAARKELAKQAGIENYSGRADQNIELNKWVFANYEGDKFIGSTPTEEKTPEIQMPEAEISGGISKTDEGTQPQGEGIVPQPQAVQTLNKTTEVTPPKKEDAGKIELPGVKEQWVQAYPGGPWYPKQRAGKGLIQNISTGGAEKGLQAGGDPYKAYIDSLTAFNFGHSLLKSKLYSDFSVSNNEQKLLDYYEKGTPLPEGWLKPLTDQSIKRGLYHSTGSYTMDKYNKLVKPIGVDRNDYDDYLIYKKPIKPKPEPIKLETKPLEKIKTKEPEKELIQRPKEKGTIKLPQSAKQWKQNPATGTWHQIERPVKPEYLESRKIGFAHAKGGKTLLGLCL